MSADDHGGQDQQSEKIVPQRPSIAARCADFEARYPDVFPEFCALATSWLEAGYRGFSPRTVLEVMRLERIKHAKQFAFNSDFIAVWVRRLISQDRRFSVVFHPRTLRPRRDAGA
jgi:hypothetical protein